MNLPQLNKDQQKALDFIADRFIEGKLSRTQDLMTHFQWSKEKVVTILEELHALGMLGKRQKTLS